MSDIWPDNKTKAQFMQEITTCWQMVEQQKAEIERLHEREMNAKCCHCGGVIFTVEDKWAKAKAEIERLHKLMDDAEDVMRRQREKRLAQKTEIERLRRELAEIGSPQVELRIEGMKRVREALGE